ncbi:PF13910 domain protein [Staphylococcus aureus subsp. aureus CO-98]|nr:PF13910 domain protein [Staphylococcus aureus subsp. aureus CO-98]
MEKFKEKVNDLEAIKTTRYYTEFVEKFKKIRDWAKNENLKNEAKLAQYEIEIFSLCEKNPILSKNKSEKRFVATISFDDGREWPDIQKFTNDQIKYYEQRLNETNNLFLKVRYSDFLFEHGNKKITKTKYEISKCLLSCLVEILTYYSDDFNYTSVLARLVEVSLLMGDREKLEKAIELIYLKMDEFDYNNEYSYVYELSKLIREILKSKHKKIILENHLNKIIIVLEKAIKNNFEDKNYYLHRVFCEELSQYRKFDLISSERRSELKKEIGKSYELEAEYQQGRNNKSLLVKANFLEKAMEKYMEIGEREKSNKMKILVKWTYEEYENSNEMNLIRIPIEFPKEEIDKIIEGFISSDVQISLDKIAYSNDLIPKITVIEDLVDKLSKEFPLQGLISKGLLNDGKKVVETTTEEDNKTINFNSNYMHHLNINVELLLKAIFDKLISEFEISTEDFMQKFSKWELLDNKNVPFIEHGISRFLEKDYLSALHILVPQFESTVRRMFSKAGYSTTSIRKGNTQQEVTFNEFLLRDDVKSTLGNDVHKLIQIVMVEQSGLNLRNEIAHGLIELSNINYTKCILVIYLFLILTRYSIEKND